MRESSDARRRGSATSPETRRQQIPPRRQLLAIAMAAFLLLCACAATTARIGGWIAGIVTGENPLAFESGKTAPANWPASSAELTVAVSPTMARTLQERADRFNGLGLRTADGEPMRVDLVSMSSLEMAQRSLQQPGFQAIAPDSSLWLTYIDRRWSGLFPAAPGALPATRVGQSTRFAVSPIVIAARAQTARQLGWPQHDIGWKEIHAQAAVDLRWNRPDTDSAAGLLATLAAFYAGADITHGLTAEIATRPDALDYVRWAEAAMHVQREAEAAAPERSSFRSGHTLQETKMDTTNLDAFVAQEQALIAQNRTLHRDRFRLTGSRNAEPALQDDMFVAIYPKEGTLWADHPLALLELDGRAGPAVTHNQLRTYQAFAKFLRDEESQMALLQAGYRPVDPNIDLKAAPSPFADSVAVDSLQPEAVMPRPSESVIETLLHVWRFTKRPAHVILVVDTSESMEGSELAAVQTALHAFTAQFQGDRDRIGLMEFGSGVKRFDPVRRLDDDGRNHLSALIENMQASGYTALMDAVWTAHAELQGMADNDAVNAIVVLTDGRDNNSHFRLRDLRQAIGDAQVPVAIHTIAFGRDADTALLKNMARIGDGQFYRADRMSIEETYRSISTSMQTTR